MGQCLLSAVALTLVTLTLWCCTCFRINSRPVAVYC